MKSLLTVLMMTSAAFAQPFAQPDRDNPGDEMIQTYLANLAKQLDAKFADDCKSLADWERERPRLKEEYLYMLGLWPLPEKTSLQATITGEVKGDGFVVEKLHYQSKPQLYCTANVYRPATIEPGQKLPAVLYVCGHSGMGRNGNKTAFQSHGIWLARHGYVCLMVDTLQLGEIAAIHHGTYRENRWWWHSRGYTPAGVECWNGVRGIDYLVSRPDVDPNKIAVTGISGGGAATFWVAAADERVQVAVPVSGMADLESYVGNRVINGHCDCMFLYNTFEWPWTRIAGLIAPRPMLFTNSDNDRIFPMDANDRISNRLEALYSHYGAGDRFDTLVSVGGHDYRADLRQGIFRFLNTHLKNDPAIVTDAEVDLPVKVDKDSKYPIPPEQLRAFASDADLPRDQLNTTIDEHFVPLGDPGLPTSKEDYPAWREKLHRELRRVSFRPLPERIDEVRLVKNEAANADGWLPQWIESEDGIHVKFEIPIVGGGTKRIVLVCVSDTDPGKSVDTIRRHLSEDDAIILVHLRGTASSRWTRKNPPNYVERSHVLVGRTVDLGRVRDVIAFARLAKVQKFYGDVNTKAPVWVAGEGSNAILAAYAALWSDDIAGVIAVNPPASHHAPDAPQFLNVLRVADVPVILGSLAPKPLTLIDAKGDVRPTVEKIYKTAGAELVP